MSKPSCLVIVVLEDVHHKMLLYRYLRRRGLREHEIRIEQSPSGQGSAENWIRKTFVKEVTVYRSRHAQTALIVVIDADTGTVQDRLNQLNQALTEAGKPTISPATEKIARLAPRRHIETWIRCLNGDAVNEESNYKQRDDWNQLIRHAAETLNQWTRSDDALPEYCVDSLRQGIRELKRLMV